MIYKSPDDCITFISPSKQMEAPTNIFKTNLFNLLHELKSYLEIFSLLDVKTWLGIVPGMEGGREKLVEKVGGKCMYVCMYVAHVDKDTQSLPLVEV